MPATSAASTRSTIAAASVIVVAYLTGMRPQEVFGLERGCCTPDPDNDGGYLVRGRYFKRAYNSDGDYLPNGKERKHPWRAVKPVADAIEIAEQLHEGKTLYPGWVFTNQRDPEQTEKPPAQASRRWLLDKFGRWASARAADIGEEVIDLVRDEDGLVSFGRFRRTLAWFIYRQPQGRVSLGIQYGHVSSLTTDGYGSRTGHGVREVLEMENVFAIRDNLEHAAAQLDAGATVSGPAAERYIAAAQQYSATFEGVAVMDFRASRDLLRDNTLEIHDGPGQFMACKFNASTALCHKPGPKKASVRATPDILGCRPECTNIARTDEHIARIREAADAIRLEIADGATPLPLRERLASRLEHYETLITQHEQTAIGLDDV